MLDSFPFSPISDNLEREDFVRFANRYSQLLAAQIPSTGNVYFVGKSEPFPKIYTDPAKGKKLQACYARLLSGEMTSDIVEDCCLFAIPLIDGSRLVVLISELDRLLVERAASQWLEEIREKLIRECVQIKQAFTDTESGLLNSTHLFSVMQSQSIHADVAVILVDLPFRGKAGKDSFRNAQKAASSLKSFTDSRYMIHHVGQCVFALLVRVSDISSIEQFSSGLVHLLKKERFYRVHIGSSKLVSGDDSTSGETALNEAWTALQTARKRGPFSFCDYSILSNTDDHPLRISSPDVRKEFRRISGKADNFCILKIKGTNLPDQELLSGADGLGHQNAISFGDKDEVFVYLPELNGENGLDFSKKLLVELQDHYGVTDLFIGVSVFPTHNFSRSDTLINAQKALLHAEFFGAGNSVLFDAVSLNISGDIYFSDGDLPRAVREYLAGLALDASDVNLLNSLGVSYALLNKNTLARKAFDTVIEIDNHNHMALYNLGLGAQTRGDLFDALDCFNQAYSLCHTSDEGREICHDLRLQLGILYCQTSDFVKSLEYLNEWLAESTSGQQARAFRYLGESYLGIGQPGEAMVWLEKALQKNQFDHELLSLLGTAICKAGEGDEIALSLCAKSVDLAPEDAVLRTRLARVQIQSGLADEALLNLKRCRGKRINPIEVQLLKASAYSKLQNSGRAGYWVKRALTQCEAGSDLYKEAKALLKILE
ncbi:tetratricopeptide repeat protein [Desulfosediminicola flagellatus]|uniref:tetratricopeptide repeat protein n=1 Tax=Desulfosediminicola flagellatus TaxID=2569541 RepID=UPI0010ACB65D|nr:tetratricopeptide repeat protein [Desulfosediminicola flagellatus]